MKHKLIIDRRQCFYPGCKRPAEQWHHVWPRCITKQRSTDLRGAVPACRKHHAVATADSTLVRAGSVCWEATTAGKRNLNKLIRRYHEGRTLARLGKEFDISGQTVSVVLTRQGIPKRTSGESQRRFTPSEETTIRCEYEAGATSSDLSRKYKCFPNNIWIAVRRAGGVPRAGSGVPQAFDDHECQTIRKQYESGLSTISLGNKYQCHPGTIGRAVRRAGGTLRTR